jgi:hypothetical protein
MKKEGKLKYSGWPAIACHRISSRLLSFRQIRAEGDRARGS